MLPKRRAVIDVGTNSVKLLVADVSGREVRPVLEDSKQTRLGQGFYETHRLQPAAVTKTAAMAAQFAWKARELKAESVRIIATSAARDAKNPAELTSAIENASGFKVEIITGEQEADWTFQGVTSDPAFADLPILLLDVGGGSTEFILGHGENRHFQRSFPLGTVRLLERNPHSDPPRPEELAHCRSIIREFLRREVDPALSPALRRESRIDSRQREVQLVGTGGTTTILARMEAGLADFDREVIESTRLGVDRMRWHVEHLWGMTFARRQEIVGLPKKRADVILLGSAIFEGVMEIFGLEELRVSTRSLRYAALMDGA